MIDLYAYKQFMDIKCFPSFDVEHFKLDLNKKIFHSLRLFMIVESIFLDFHQIMKHLVHFYIMN